MRRRANELGCVLLLIFFLTTGYCKAPGHVSSILSRVFFAVAATDPKSASVSFKAWEVEESVVC